jgi:NTE family protein
MKKIVFAIPIVFIILVSCTETYMVIKDPPNMPAPRVLKQKPRVALALGGGAFHGIAHVGVLKVLEEAGIPIDYIVGASAGSLVGCMYADQPHADSLLGLIETTKASNVFDFSLFRSKEGFVSGKRLQKFIRANCHSENIEQLKIPFAAMVTDLINGKSIVLSSGPIAPSVNASSAIPLVFEPVKMYGLTLVDGGILDNIPADVARASGADVVIAVDIMASHDSAIEIDNFMKVGIRAIMLMASQFKSSQAAYADIVIAPDLKDIPYMSGKYNMKACEAGIKAATDALPEIKRILQSKGIL